MIFRRSLVRELTLTAIGLFLILLAILFTNLVLRLLARAAGGAIAPDGIAALYRVSDYDALVPRQRDDRVVYRWTVDRGVDEADPSVCRSVPCRDPRALAVPLAVGRAPQARVRAAARIARRDRAARAGAV